jgi:hypothetical protein
VPVSNRTREVLTDFIKKSVQTGSVINTDRWSGYSDEDIRDITGNRLRTVNHTYNFVDTISGAHIQHCEGK